MDSSNTTNNERYERTDDFYNSYQFPAPARSSYPVTDNEATPRRPKHKPLIQQNYKHGYSRTNSRPRPSAYGEFAGFNPYENPFDVPHSPHPDDSEEDQSGNGDNNKFNSAFDDANNMDDAPPSPRANSTHLSQFAMSPDYRHISYPNSRPQQNRSVTAPQPSFGDDSFGEPDDDVGATRISNSVERFGISTDPETARQQRRTRREGRHGRESFQVPQGNVLGLAERFEQANLGAAAGREKTNLGREQSPVAGRNPLKNGPRKESGPRFGEGERNPRDQFSQLARNPLSYAGESSRPYEEAGRRSEESFRRFEEEQGRKAQKSFSRVQEQGRSFSDNPARGMEQADVNRFDQPSGRFGEPSRSFSENSARGMEQMDGRYDQPAPNFEEPSRSFSDPSALGLPLEHRYDEPRSFDTEPRSFETEARSFDTEPRSFDSEPTGSFRPPVLNYTNSPRGFDAPTRSYTDSSGRPIEESSGGFSQSDEDEYMQQLALSYHDQPLGDFAESQRALLERPEQSFSRPQESSEQESGRGAVLWQHGHSTEESLDSFPSMPHEESEVSGPSAILQLGDTVFPVIRNAILRGTLDPSRGMANMFLHGDSLNGGLQLRERFLKELGHFLMTSDPQGQAITMNRKLSELNAYQHAIHSKMAKAQSELSHREDALAQREAHLASREQHISTIEAQHSKIQKSLGKRTREIARQENLVVARQSHFQSSAMLLTCNTMRDVNLQLVEGWVELREEQSQWAEMREDPMAFAMRGELGKLHDQLHWAKIAKSQAERQCEVDRQQRREAEERVKCLLELQKDHLARIKVLDDANLKRRLDEQDKMERERRATAKSEAGKKERPSLGGGKSRGGSMGANAWNKMRSFSTKRDS